MEERSPRRGRRLGVEEVEKRNELLGEVMISNYVIKVGWEAAITPVTYKAVSFLKKAEREDHYDYQTNFTPFSIKV